MHWLMHLLTQAFKFLKKTNKLKNKTQATQNKCVQFCHSLDEMIHISQNEFEKLNWLPMLIKIN